MGFYVNNKEELVTQEEENIDDDIIENKGNKSKKISYYIGVIIIALIFTCFGIYIGKRIFFSRRKKVNELIDDYYQYNSDKKEIIKKEDNKNEKNTFTSIEMNSRIKNKE